MGVERLLCLTLNTNDSQKQFLGQILPKIQLKWEGFSYILCLNLNIEDFGNAFLAF